MLGLILCPPKVGIISRVIALQRIHLHDSFPFGPFNSSIQKRWKKPVDSAQTRLESRTRDLRLDKLMVQLKQVKLVIAVHELISKRRGHFASVQLLSGWRHMVGLNISIGDFLRKHPHIFEIFSHPVKKNICCKTTQKMVDLIEEEALIIKESELAAVQRLKKLLMMSVDRTLNIHGVWLIRRELGLPDDFRDSVLPKYSGDFALTYPDTLSLISADESLPEAEVEKWRKKEYDDKWLSETETKYAFPINFPTGFKIEKGCRARLKNWQMLPYLKPYEHKAVTRVCNVERFEKRAVGILHEFLSLTVEKMAEVERLSHFRRSFSMEVNVRELILKHPGIFYISTKGNLQTVLLKEAYSKGFLIEPNPIYAVRRKMLDLVLLGPRNTSQMRILEERYNQSKIEYFEDDHHDGDWVIPILEGVNERHTMKSHTNCIMNSMCDQSDEEVDWHVKRWPYNSVLELSTKIRLQIADCIPNTLEPRSIHTTRTTNNSFMRKLDYAKAFDKLKRNFVLKVLSTLAQKYLAAVDSLPTLHRKECSNDHRFVELVQMQKWGLRCLLSPLLLIIAVDALNMLILSSTSKSSFELYQ